MVIPNRIIDSSSTFLTSSCGASAFKAIICLENLESVLYAKAQKKWLSMTNECESSGIRWRSENLKSTCLRHGCIRVSIREESRSENVNSVHSRLGIQWLIVLPCKQLGLNCDDQQLGIPRKLRVEKMQQIFQVETCF